MNDGYSKDHQTRSRAMRSMLRVGPKGKAAAVNRKAHEALVADAAGGLDSRVALIQALIPLGLEAVNDLLQQEVTALAGPRYQRDAGLPGHARWGSQPGSVYLADQKVAVDVPRVRDVRQGQEVPLSSYQQLRQPRRAEEAALRKVLKGLSCRDYESCVEPVAETFGLAPSSLSRRFKRASARKLAELQERELSDYDLVALFLDGKTFGDDAMLIALGITLSGDKVVLGFVQTATENASVCAAFLRGLVDRGLKPEAGLLVVLDGAKGLRKAVQQVLGKPAAVQRCQWHKRENVLRYLPTGLQPAFKRKLSAAYEKPTYATAEGGAQAGSRGVGGGERFGGRQFGRGPGGDADAASLGTVQGAGPVVQDDELHRESQRAARAADPTRWTAGGTPTRSTAGWRQRCWISNRVCGRCAGTGRCRVYGQRCRPHRREVFSKLHEP